MKPRITQTDIARAAGVHNTTVSLALRNSPAIPEATRRRIQALAAQMGYRPDPALQALVAYRAGRTPVRRLQTLAYVTNWDTRWGWREMPAHEQFYAGATRKAAEAGYQFEHFWLGEPEMTERRLSSMLFHRGITGVLLASHKPDCDTLLDFDWSRFAAVKIDRFPHVPRLHYVTNDQCGIMRLAFRQVLAAGYRRIGFVMPRWRDDFVDQAWSAGFLAEQNRMPHASRVPMLLYETEGLHALSSREGQDRPVDLTLLENWFRRHRPDVIISYAPFVLDRLSELGLAVPHDIAYVDLFLSRTDGRLAGVRQNCERVGEVAVEMLVGQLHQNIFGLPAIPSATLIEGTWLEGVSLPGTRAGVRVDGAIPPAGTHASVLAMTA